MFKKKKKSKIYKKKIYKNKINLEYKKQENSILSQSTQTDNLYKQAEKIQNLLYTIDARLNLFQSSISQQKAKDEVIDHIEHMRLDFHQFPKLIDELKKETLHIFPSLPSDHEKKENIIPQGFIYLIFSFSYFFKLNFTIIKRKRR